MSQEKNCSSCYHSEDYNESLVNCVIYDDLVCRVDSCGLYRDRRG